jgi:predicted alpha-1,6-mannanase (GH76 family)
MLGRSFIRQAVPLALCLLVALVLTGCGGGLAGSSSTTTGGGGSTPTGYSQQASDGIKTLQQWYSQGSGLYATGWWHSANAITMIANYEAATGDTSYYSVLSNTFTAAQSTNSNFIDSYYDDDGWWALAWINAYDLTGNTSYLSMAETIFSHIATNGWNTTTCGGGVWWSTAETYKNAIPNELFLTIAAKLANRTTGSASAAYLSWAQQEWTWFKASGMINSQNLINDGLTSTNPQACVNNGETTWTYNQGVILGGLVELYKADQDATLLPQAEAIASAAIANLSSNGILTEPGTLSGTDGPQFKGVFMRNLMALYSALPPTGTQAVQYKAYAEANANSIWAKDQSGSYEFGGIWLGPFDTADATRQSSALDALVAAAAMQ